MSQSRAPKPRHMACQLCRDRKVRCDGTQPTCSRCRRLGSDCVYVPDKRLSLKDNEKRLNEAIRTLKDRLSNAEAKLVDQQKSPSTSPPSDSLPSIDFNIFPSNDQSFGMFAQPGDMKAFPTQSFEDMSGMLGPLLNPEELAGFATAASSGSNIHHANQPQHSSQNNQVDPRQRTSDARIELDRTSYDAYFESMHRYFPFIRHSKFIAAASSANQAPEFVALRYAVALHSVLLADPGSPNAAALYRAARASVDAAEMESESSLSELCFLQTWVLLVLYEFRQVDFFRAWMTAGRAIRLAKALGLHKMDAPASSLPQPKRPGFDPSMTPTTDTAETEDRRRTFWTIYMIDWYGSARTECEMTFDSREITTLLPAEEAAPRLCLAEVMKQFDISYPSTSPFGALAITAALYGRLLHHITLSQTFDLNSPSPKYDFWSEHWRIARQFEQWYSCLVGHLSLTNAGKDPSIIALHTMAWSIPIGLNETAASVLERNACSQAMLQDCHAKSLIAAASIANIIRGAVKSNFSFARLNSGVTWSVYMASMACLSAMRRIPGDIAVMSHLEVLLEGFQKFQPVAPRVDTFILMLCQELEDLPPSHMALPVSSSSQISLVSASSGGSRTQNFGNPAGFDMSHIFGGGNDMDFGMTDE